MKVKDQMLMLIRTKLKIITAKMVEMLVAPKFTFSTCNYKELNRSIYEAEFKSTFWKRAPSYARSVPFRRMARVRE